MIEGLFTTVTNVNFDEKTVQEMTRRVRTEKEQLCAGGDTGDYDMALLWGGAEDVRSLKSLVLFGVRGMAAYAYHAMHLGYMDEEVNRFLAKALNAVGSDLQEDALLPLVMETGENNLPVVSNALVYSIPIIINRICRKFCISTGKRICIIRVLCYMEVRTVLKCRRGCRTAEQTL